MRLYDQNIWGNMKPDQCIANRNLLIRGLIAKYDPDVCAFQECNPKTSRAGDTPIVSLLECIPQSGTPMSTVRTGSTADEIHPSVPPPAESECFANF